MFFSAKRRKKRPNYRTVNRVGGPSVAAVHARGKERVVSVIKGVRSAHTQAALTGVRTTPSAGADANGRKEDEPPQTLHTPPKRRSRSSVHRRRGRVRAI